MSQTKKGGNRTELFSLLSDWSLGEKIITFNQQVSTALTGHPKQKNLQAVLTHDKVDPEFDDFLNDYMSDDAAAADAGNYEDGSARGSTGNDPTTLVFAIIYSGKNNSEGKRRVAAFPARVTTGADMTYQDGTIESTTTIAAVSAEAAITGLDATFFDSSLVCTTSAVDVFTSTPVAVNSYGTIAWPTTA